jgi:hypothetical protein
MKCPKCDSPEVRHSHHAKWVDVFHSRLGQRAFRCRKCRHRFYALETATAADATVHKHRKKSRDPDFKRGLRRIRPWMWEAAIFLLMLVIFFIFLRYLTREPAANPEGRRSGWTVAQVHDLRARQSEC